MVAPIVICYIFCLILSLLTLIAKVYAFKHLKTKFGILPKSLKIYMLVCAVPFTAVVNLSTIFISIIFLIYEKENILPFEISRTIIAFSTQQIRNSLLVIVIERTIATIWFEKYTISSKFYILMAVESYIFAAIYTAVQGLLLWGLLVLDIRYSNLPLWVMFATHFLTLLVCPILYLLNRRMYHRYAYQINLQSRYQIFENIKVLSYIFPAMLIYTLLAPLGSTITLSCVSIFNYRPPYCTFLIFYNLGFLLIILQQLWGQKMMSPPVIPNARTTLVETVANPFGKHLPAVLTNDKYFHDLQQQWH